MLGQGKPGTAVIPELMWPANICCAILLLKQSLQTGDKDAVTGSRIKQGQRVEARAVDFNQEINSLDYREQALKTTRRETVIKNKVVTE